MLISEARSSSSDDAVNVQQSGGALELGNLDDGVGARVRICWPLASLGELERCEAEERARLAHLAERMIVLPEVALWGGRPQGNTLFSLRP